MNNETDLNSVSNPSPVSCITIEDDNDEIEVIDLDDEIEDDEPTYSFQENNDSVTLTEPLNTSNNVDANIEDFNLSDPLITDSNENNTDAEYNDDNEAAKQVRSRISLCSHRCYLKVTEEDQKKAYNEMCSRKTQLLKFELLSQLIDSHYKTASNRNFSRFFLHTKEPRKNICKMCFMCSLHISRDFLNLYFRYTFAFNRPVKKRIPKDIALIDTQISEDTKNLDITDENALDEDEVTLRDKILQLGWKRIPECESNCSSGVSHEEHKRIFISYWLRTSREERYKFISDMTDISYNKSIVTFTYHLYTNQGLVKLCKSCFRIALNETESFIRQALKIKCFKLQSSNVHGRSIFKKFTQEIIDLEIETIDIDSNTNNCDNIKNSNDINEKTNSTNLSEDNLSDKKDSNDENNEKKDFCNENNQEENNVEDNNNMESELKKLNSEDSNDFDDIFETMENLKYSTVDKYLEDKYNIRLSSRGCGCYLNITRDHSKRGYYSYWKKSIATRIKFIKDNTEFPRSTWKCPKQALRRTKFFFYCSRGRRKICKVCFLSILDISKIFLDLVMEEIANKQRDNSVTLGSIEIDKITGSEKALNNDILIESKLSQGWICLEKCKFNCFKKISVEEQENVFNIYWRDSTPESRFAFISEMIEIIKRVNFHHIFYLITSRGKVRVCKGCFRATINESKEYVVDVMRKKYQTAVSTFSLIFNKLHQGNVDGNFQINSMNRQALSTSSTKNDNADGNKDIDIDDIDDTDDDDDEDEYDEKEKEKNNTNEDIIDESMLKDTNVNTLRDIELFNPHIPLKDCSRGCNLWITEERQMEIFQCYTKNATDEMKKKFIREMTEVKPTIANSNKRFITNFYLYSNSLMKMQKVCKECFIAILHEGVYFIQKIIEETFFSNKINSTISQLDSSENHHLKIKNTNDTTDSENCKCQTKSTEKWTPLLPCINDCHLKLTEIEQRNIFLTYWQEKLFESRSNFINRRTELTLQENCEPDSNRIIFQTEYHFVTQRGRQKVCKYCFYHILDVSKVFVTAILNQKLYNMIKLNIIPVKPNVSFIFSDDESLQPRTSELENQVACNYCITHCEIKIEQGMPSLFPCNNLCHIKLSKTDKNRVFYDYYCQEKTIEVREKFICDMLKNITIIKKNDLANKNQQNEIEFCLHTEQTIVTVCNTCFARIIKESQEFIENAIKNKTIKYEDQLKLKNSQIYQSTTKSNESISENVTPHFLNVDTSVNSDGEFQEDNNLSNNKHEVLIEKEQHFEEVILKVEAVDETSFSDENMEPETEKLEDDENQELVDETNFQDVEMKSYELEETSTVKIDDTKSLNNSCTLKTKNEGETVSPDMGEKLEERITEESVKEKILFDDFAIKTECKEENIVIDENSKSDLNQVTHPTISPLKRKARQISNEDNEESFLGLSIIKEEVDLETDPYLEEEKYEGPSEKIAKTDFLNPNNISDQANKKLNIQVVNIKQEPIVYKIPLKEAGKIQGIILKKRGGGGGRRSRRKTIIEPNIKTKIKKPQYNYHKLKAVQESFIENEMENILKKVPNENLKNLTACEEPSQNDIEKVEQHIKKFPLCESYHYNVTTSEKYLPMGLTSKIMYDLYKQEVSQPVSSIWYNKLLEKTELKFRSSFLTKCDVCTAFDDQYKNAIHSIEKSKIYSNRTAHIIDSEEANNSQTLDERTAIKDKSYHVCSFGFQQSLPTPYLTEQISFYKQRLWTYNFTIRNHHMKKNRDFRKLYFWHEHQGTRSINEVASCLYSYLNSLSDRIRNIVFYSISNDLTTNKTLAAMFLYVVANHEKLESIEHKFLTSGHSQIEVYLGGKNVQELMTKHQDTIHEPNDWLEAFKKSTRKSEYEIRNETNFYDFDEIRNEIFSESHQFTSEENIKCLRYTKQGIYYKTGWSSSNRFQLMDLNGSLIILKAMKLKNLPRISISEEKKMDLLDLVPFLLTKAHNFYKKLLTGELDNDDEKCKEITNNDATISTDEISIIEEEAKECENIPDENDDIEEICIIENKNNVLPKVNDQQEEKDTKLLYENPHKNNEFQLVLIKEDEFEQP
ncbi:uncharacterized protein LOC122506956 [Leptopilina heterotoma]|uniref:uncharacterized protein LOC122506956 n=1 Tax=Leptopilina heterotoma TaxID=63436 RepID=UPI001CA862CE|nr:uncharacterized protein LOC122506956 [Leptopilina heterotoma]